MSAFDFAPLVFEKNTTITQAMTPGSPANGGTLTVTDDSVFSSPNGYALIENELIHYDTHISSTLALNAVDGRGSGGTIAAAHNISTTIYADVLVAAHINQLVNASPKTILTAKGGLLVASGANAPAMLAVGTDGQIVVADSTQPNGLNYTDLPAQSLIADVLLSNPAANIDFSSIPATYKHLLMRISAHGEYAGTTVPLLLTMNGDGGSNYDSINYTYRKTGLVESEILASTSLYLFVSITDTGSAVANSFTSMWVYLPNYANTSVYKSFVLAGQQNYSEATNGISVGGGGGMWKSTAAINRLTLTPQNSTLSANSRATLYGMI